MAHAEAKGIEPRALLDARLFPDMLPFIRQIQIAADAARRGTDRLQGKEPASVPDNETTFAELKARLASSIESIQACDRAAVEASEDKKLILPLGPNRSHEFTGRSFLLGFSLPNFLFHVTTAYDILRHNGIELGKLDYLKPFVPDLEF